MTTHTEQLLLTVINTLTADGYTTTVSHEFATTRAWARHGTRLVTLTPEGDRIGAYMELDYGPTDGKCYIDSVRLKTPAGLLHRIRAFLR